MSKLYMPPWRASVEIEEGTLIARPSTQHPAHKLFGFGPVKRAYEIALIAHASAGQTRADKATPYIVHPLHVAALAYEWSLAAAPPPGTEMQRMALVVVALLHDVLEDTKLRAGDLAALGVDALSVNDVVTLTKDDPQAYEGFTYFSACAGRYVPWLVKVADRVSNLLSAAEMAVPGKRNQRWKNYVDRTRSEMIPVYERHCPDGVSFVVRDAVLAALHSAAHIAEEATK